MPYMQRITWSGIALHAGPLPGYPTSHGCIRLPEAFAIRLWGMTKLGARVIVTREAAAPVAITHPRLFMPKKKPAEVPIAGRPEPIKTIEVAAATNVTDDGLVKSAAPASERKVLEEIGKTSAPPSRKGPVQIFVSRRDAKVYVRQDFAPLFEATAIIADPTQPWGTHVFTIMDIKDNAARWSAVTIPSSYRGKPEKVSRKLADADRRAKPEPEPTAQQALDRFDLPPDAVARISELLAPGSGLIVSDNALSDETGEGTDFVVLTR